VQVGRLFQSTPPSREATRDADRDAADDLVSIHAPPHGRRQKPRVLAKRDGVSIHAPLTGGDLPDSASLLRPSWFQSTPPSREATSRARERMVNRMFQSTPPSREATRGRAIVQVGRLFQSTPPSREATRDADRDAADDLVSIHAPLTGGDTRRLPVIDIERQFQSTPPSREATGA